MFLKQGLLLLAVLVILSSCGTDGKCSCDPEPDHVKPDLVLLDGNSYKPLDPLKLIHGTPIKNAKVRLVFRLTNINIQIGKDEDNLIGFKMVYNGVTFGDVCAQANYTSNLDESKRDLDYPGENDYLVFPDGYEKGTSVYIDCRAIYNKYVLKDQYLNSLSFNRGSVDALIWLENRVRGNITDKYKYSFGINYKTNILFFAELDNNDIILKILDTVTYQDDKNNNLILQNIHLINFNSINSSVSSSALVQSFSPNGIKYFEDYIVPMPILGDGQAAATEKDIAAPEYSIPMFSNGTLEAYVTSVGGVAKALLRVITPSNKRVQQKFTVEKTGSSFSFHATCTDSAEGFAWKVFPKNCNKLGIGWRRKYVMTAPPNASYWGTDISELFQDQFSPNFYSSGFTNYYLSFNVKNPEVFEGVEFVVLFGDKGYLESLDYNQYQNSKSNQAAFVTCIPIGTSNSYEEYPELIVQYDDSFWNDLIKISAYVPSLGSGTVDIAVSFTNGNNESYWPGRIFYNIQPQTIIMPGSAGNQIPIIDLDTTNIFIQNKFPYRVTIYAKNGIKVTSNYIENLFLIRPGMYYTNNYFLFDPTRIKITSGSGYEYFRFIGNQINPDSALNAESFNLQFNDIDYGTAIEDRKFSIYLFKATNSMPMNQYSYYLHSSSKEYFSGKYNTGNYGRIDIQLRLLQDISGMHKVGNLYTLAVVYNENGLCYTNVLPMADWFAVYDKVMLDILQGFCDIDYGIRDWRHRQNGSRIETAVAYSWACKDTVEHFNDDLDEAKTWLNNTNYKSPPDDWSQYISGTFADHSYVPRREEDDDVRWASGPPNDWKYHPKLWAGIDCSGFVQRGAKYHKILEDTGKLIPELRITKSILPIDYNTYISTYLGTADFESNLYTTEVTNMQLLVPGDILVRPNVHVVAVWKIDNTQRKRGNWTAVDIKVIEAEGLDYGYVVHQKNLSHYLPPMYKLRRLKE